MHHSIDNATYQRSSPRYVTKHLRTTLAAFPRSDTMMTPRLRTLSAISLNSIVSVRTTHLDGPTVSLFTVSVGATVRPMTPLQHTTPLHPNRDFSAAI